MKTGSCFSKYGATRGISRAANGAVRRIERAERVNIYEKEKRREVII